MEVRNEMKGYDLGMMGYDMIRYDTYEIATTI